jgi:hypothetical protein
VSNNHLVIKWLLAFGKRRMTNSNYTLPKVSWLCFKPFEGSLWELLFHFSAPFIFDDIKR